MKYRRLNAGTHYRTHQVVFFSDECLDGPACANHVRYVFETEGLSGAIKSFEVAKKTSWDSKAFGDITNIIMADETRSEEELREFGIMPREDTTNTAVADAASSKEERSEPDKWVTIDYPQFITLLCEQLGGKSSTTAQQLMQNLEMDMGTNSQRIKSNVVTRIEFPKPSLISGVDVVRSSDRNDADPEIKFKNVTIDFAALIGDEHAEYLRLRAIAYTRQFNEYMPAQEQESYYRMSEEYSPKIKALEQAAGIRILYNGQCDRVTNEDAFKAYLQEHCSEEHYQQFCAAITTAEQSSTAPSMV